MIKQIHRICSWGDTYYSTKEDKVELLKADMVALHKNITSDISFRDALYVCGQGIIISTLIEYYSDGRMSSSIESYLATISQMGFKDSYTVGQKLVDAILDSRYTKVLDGEGNIIEGSSFACVSFEFLEDEIKKILASKIDLGN